MSIKQTSTLTLLTLATLQSLSDTAVAWNFHHDNKDETTSEETEVITEPLYKT